MKIRWPFTLARVELLSALKDNARLSEELANALHKLEMMRSYFDRMVVVEPRTRSSKAKAVTMAIPEPVLNELRKGGDHLTQEFAREVSRRLVYRALRELFDSPTEVVTVNKQN